MFQRVCQGGSSVEARQAGDIGFGRSSADAIAVGGFTRARDRVDHEIECPLRDEVQNVGGALCIDSFGDQDVVRRRRRDQRAAKALVAPQGFRVPAPSNALRSAPGNVASIPSTSPVDFISGPRIVSTPRIFANENTGTFTTTNGT